MTSPTAHLPETVPVHERSQPVALAIIGTGGMAKVHAKHFVGDKNCRIVAACDIDPARVAAFAQEFQIPKFFTDSDQLLADPTIEAVSIVAPDPFHAPLTLATLKAGKHVLCEKPLALNYESARIMENAATTTGLIHMVNLSYRDWPALQAIAALTENGTIGDLRHVEASYHQAWLVSSSWGDWRTTPTWLWRLSTRHGSNGVLGDLGVHIIDFACFPAGPITKVYCQLKTFSKVPENRIGEYVLDANDSAILNVTFANGAIGVLHTTRWCGAHPNRVFLKLSGTLGTIEFDSDLATNAYRICAGADLDTNTWTKVEVPATPTNYARFIQAVFSGKQDTPSFHDGAAGQKVLDAASLSAREDRPVTL